MLVISTSAAFQPTQIGTNAVRLCVDQEFKRGAKSIPCSRVRRGLPGGTIQRRRIRHPNTHPENVPIIIQSRHHYEPATS